jgi:tripartite-type tricarboxylate transporter receptor subunit TctC
MNRRYLLAHACAVAASPIVALAQERPISLVVPYAPGGTTDMLGRLLAQEMAPLLGRAIVVENMPGAGSSIGAAHVARAVPDGSTLLVATSTTLAINPWIYPKLGYDPAKDFAPIGMIGAVPLCVAVPATSPVRDIAGLVAASNARAEGFTFGSAGNGSPHHLAAELFKAGTGARLTHVPYKGSAPAIVDLLAGRLDVMFSDIAPVLPHLKSGGLRALAVTSAQRQRVLPQVPTVAESGVAGTGDYEAVAWQALVAPAGTPPVRVQRATEALRAVMSRAALRERLEAEGFEPRPGGADDLAASVRSDTERWGRLIRTRLVGLSTPG